MWSRKQFDDALPTLVRYVGLVLSVVLTVALILGHSEVVAGFVPVAGMLLFRTVKEAAAEPSDA